MTDAGSGALSSKRSADFEAHLLDCAACREELHRVETLLRAIDSGVSASVAAEPSPQLAARIWRAIAAQPNRAREWWPRSAWLTAVGVCATLAICFFAVRASRNTQQPASHYSSRPAGALSGQNGIATTPTRIRRSEADKLPSPPKPLFVLHHATLRGPRKPQVIVEPGQMQVVLAFVAAMRRGQMDGAEFLAGEKKIAAPLEIQPITIAPLQIATLKDESELSVSDGKLDDTKNFVNARSN